jgi:hypothetical protein
MQREYFRGYLTLCGSRYVYWARLAILLPFHKLVEEDLLQGARVGLEVVEAISIVVSLGMFIDCTGYLGRGDGEAGTRDARHKW